MSEYAAMSVELDELAGKMAAENRPLGAAHCRNAARIALRAARAERYDPIPLLEPYRPCCAVCTHWLSNVRSWQVQL